MPTCAHWAHALTDSQGKADMLLKLCRAGRSAATFPPAPPLPSTACTATQTKKRKTEAEKATTKKRLHIETGPTRVDIAFQCRVQDLKWRKWGMGLCVPVGQVIIQFVLFRGRISQVHLCIIMIMLGVFCQVPPLQRYSETAHSCL